MAVKASATVTLSSVVDVKSVWRYYKLQASTLSKPSKPTDNPPSGWTTTEPSYTSGSTNSLYFCDLTVFCDDAFVYSDVSLSSSYEAAKAAYNKAVAAQNAANSAQNTANNKGIDYSQGTMLYTDPTFASGTNSIKVYNNSSNSNVTVTRTEKEKSSDNPFSGTSYELTITNIGTSDPGCGGFSFQNESRANAVFIYRIFAKIPTGRNIIWAANAFGNGSSVTWLTSQAGTGKFTEYVCKAVCGATGTFSTIGFFYINGSVGSTSSPVKWYVAYATCFDMTATSDTLSITTRITNNETTTTQKIASLESSITQRLNSVVTEFANTKKYIDGSTGVVRNWIRQGTMKSDSSGDDGTIPYLELGGSGSSFEARLTNSELGFYENNNRLAWLGNDQLHVTSADIDNASIGQLSIGPYQLIYKNKHFMIIYTGNKIDTT